MSLLSFLCLAISSNPIIPDRHPTKMPDICCFFRSEAKGFKESNIPQRTGLIYSLDSVSEMTQLPVHPFTPSVRWTYTCFLPLVLSSVHLFLLKFWHPRSAPSCWLVSVATYSHTILTPTHTWHPVSICNVDSLVFPDQASEASDCCSGFLC